MSHFDPDFLIHFRSASAYRFRTTDHEDKFRAFRQFASHDDHQGGATTHHDFREPFVIQFVCHPNFHAHEKTITYFVLGDAAAAGGDVSFQESSTMPDGFRRANCYKNYKSKGGHPKGLFYELNLYTRDGRSTHHTSRVHGSTFSRDDGHDQAQGSTLGKHWLDEEE
jgi:hypothetical protein